MNIWAWVESLHDELEQAGQDRLANLIYRIPNDLHENRYQQVEAAIPEAIAGAKALRNPWLEVFFRHWGMQNRVSNMSEGSKALPDAVALMEFAHREETISCPQSICVTHDITICYGNADGPGWVPERLAVSQETLDRIEPSRNCYDCLSREYAAALRDDGKYEQALHYLAEQAAKMEAANNQTSVAYKEVQAEVLRELGRYTEALALLQKIDDDAQDDDDDGDKQNRQLDRARIYAQMGRIDEAKEILPPWSEIVPRSYQTWIFTMYDICQHDTSRNNWQLGRLIQEALDYMVDAGAYRRVINLAIRHAKLAIARGSAWTAQRALQTAKQAIPNLRLVLDAQDQINEVEALLAAMPPAAPLPVPADQLLSFIREQEEGNPETDIGWLIAAMQANPNDQDLVESSYNAMMACNAKQQAIDLLWRFTRQHLADVQQPLYLLLSLLIEQDQAQELDQLAKLLMPVRPIDAHWCLARWANKNKDWALAIQHVQALLALSPQSMGALNLWANACFAQQDFKASLGVRQQMLDLHLQNTEEPNYNYHWDVVTAASAAQDWKVVRELAKVLEIQLSPGADDEVVEESWNWIWLRFSEDGQEQTYLGQRTGLTTARIKSISGPQSRQHYGDWVVFNPNMLEEPPQDEAEKQDFIPTFAVVHTLKAGNYQSWLVDGPQVSDEQFEALEQALEEQACGVYRPNAENYTVQDPQSESRLPGMYFLVATPPDLSPAQAHDLLTRLTASWTRPMCWLHLAEKAGVDIEKHQQLIELYDL